MTPTNIKTVRVSALYAGGEFGQFSARLACNVLCPRQQLAADLMAARLRHHHQLLDLADPAGVMQVKLHMQANHADDMPVQFGELVTHIVILQIGDKTCVERLTIELRLGVLSSSLIFQSLSALT
jgi:hypothetical protein